MARVTRIAMPMWSDDPGELADLWRWLDDQCWPDDGGRAPDVPYFLENGHKWADAREAMISERRAA